MQIVNNQLNTLISNSGASRETGRSREQDDVRGQTDIRSRNAQSTQQSNNSGGTDEVFISDAARQSLEQQEVLPANRGEPAQSSYQYYPFPEEQEGLSTSQQKALQAYSSNQQISRETEGSGEFLGTVDTFV